jgi:CheY-like chemotaxis protein
MGRSRTEIGGRDGHRQPISLENDHGAVRAPDGTRRGGTAMGIRDYVTNPNIVQALNRAIDRAFGRRRKAIPTTGRVLVIDSDAERRMALAEQLHSAGHQVVGAQDERVALGIHDANPAEIVIVDIDELAGAGLRTITGFRDRAPAVRVIAVTGGERPNGMDAVALTVAQRTLRRPLERERLLTAVEELLED